MLLSILCLLDPHPDNCVRQYFSDSSDRTAFALRDRLFFLHLFDLTLKKLNSIEFESKTAAELPGLWREWLKSNRSYFYGYVTRTVCFSALFAYRCLKTMHRRTKTSSEARKRN